MARSLIPLDVIASDLVGDLDDSTGKRKFKFTRHLVNGYRRLNMFLAGKTEVKSILVGFSNVIALPCDFQYVTKVGVRRNGCIAVLSVSNDVNRRVMTDTATCDYLTGIWEGNSTGPSYTFHNVWSGGRSYGEMYGMGRTVYNNGAYSIDKSEGLIYLGSNIPVDAEIIVEYVGNGISNGLSMVPMELKECLEFYAKWKYYADRNPSMANTNHELYKKEYNILKRFYNHQNPIDFAAKVNEMISPTNY